MHAQQFNLESIGKHAFATDVAVAVMLLHYSPITLPLDAT
jgi:hypothetical protein